MACSFPCPHGGRQEGTSLSFYLVRRASKRPCRKHDLFIWDHETQRLQDPKQELWRETLWPDGELDDLGIEFVGQDGWDKEWPKWKRADLELPPRDLAQAALVWALGTNRARLCLVDFKGARAKETQSSRWRRQCLPLTSERKGWPWSSATAGGSPSQTLNPPLSCLWRKQSILVRERGPRSRWGNGEHGLDPSPGRRSSAISAVESFNFCLGLIHFIMKKKEISFIMKKD